MVELQLETQRPLNRAFNTLRRWPLLLVLCFGCLLGTQQACDPSPSSEPSSESVVLPDQEHSASLVEVSTLSERLPPDESPEPSPNETLREPPNSTELGNDASAESPVPEQPNEIPPEASKPDTWAVALGDNADDILGTQIAVDATQHVYIAGRFRGKTRLGNQILQAPKDFDGFVSKLSPQGQVLWTLHLAGDGLQEVRDLHVLASGDLLVTGNFTQDLQVAGQKRVAVQGGCFLFRVNPQGALQWLVQAGDAGADLGQAITTDSQDNIYLLGSFSGKARFGSISLTQGGFYDLFVTQLNAKGEFQWVTTTTGSATSTANDIAIDSQNQLYVVGQFVADIQLGTFSLTSKQMDMVVAKLSPQGAVLWAQSTTGDGVAVPHHMLLDSQERPVLIGEVEGDKSFGSLSLQQPQHGDIFVARMDKQGQFQEVKKNTGSNVHVHPYGATRTSSGQIVVAGEYTGQPSFGSQILPQASQFQAFLLSLSPQGGFASAAATTHSQPIHGRNLAHDKDGNLYVIGDFAESAQFGSQLLQPGRSQTYLFVWKRPPLPSPP